MNICVNCRHCIVPDSVVGDHRCKASPREKMIDPVTGDVGYLLAHGVSGPLVSSYESQPCRDINTHGNCDLYEAKS